MGQVKSACTSQVAHRVGAYRGFYSMDLHQDWMGRQSIVGLRIFNAIVWKGKYGYVLVRASDRMQNKMKNYAEKWVDYAEKKCWITRKFQQQNKINISKAKVDPSGLSDVWDVPCYKTQ